MSSMSSENFSVPLKGQKKQTLAKPRLILDEMCRLYGKFASYLRRVLCKTRLIFPRINGPIVFPAPVAIFIYLFYFFVTIFLYLTYFISFNVQIN